MASSITSELHSTILERIPRLNSNGSISQSSQDVNLDHYQRRAGIEPASETEKLGYALAQCV